MRDRHRLLPQKLVLLLYMDNKLTAITIEVKSKLKDYLITKEFCNPNCNRTDKNFNGKN
jgi:hypothetical protein